MKEILITLLAVTSAGGILQAKGMKQLSTRQQKIATIASATALGDMDALRLELTEALDGEMTVNEINEVLIQMYAYCGFPRSLQGITTFMNLVEQRRSNGIPDAQGEEPTTVAGGEKYRRGKSTLEQLTRIHEEAPSGANAFAPGIDTFLKEHLFADIFGRGVLGYSDRELATVACLTSLKGVDPMLGSHLNMAMNTGLTEQQLHELIEIVRPLAGDLLADNAAAILSRVAASRTQP